MRKNLGKAASRDDSSSKNSARKKGEQTKAVKRKKPDKKA